MKEDELVLKIRPPRDEKDFERLIQAAKADDHEVIAATDLVWRGKELVGYGSLGGIPMLHVWVARGKVRARESLMLLQYAENVMFRSGSRQVIMPCWDQSPFAPFMEKLGYQKLGTTTLYWKGL